MKLTPICEMKMHYTWIDFVDYGVGGQYVGMLEGTVTGDRLRGTLKSVNVPAKRPDNVNCPATTSLSLRTGDARYAWVNNTIGAVEGILNTTTDQALVRAYACENELATVPV